MTIISKIRQMMNVSNQISELQNENIILKRQLQEQKNLTTELRQKIMLLDECFRKNMSDMKKVQNIERQIKLYDFHILPGRIDLKCKASDRDGIDNIYFEMEEFAPSNDAIAYTLATMTGKSYNRIILDLEISLSAKQNIENFTGAELEVRCGQGSAKVSSVKRGKTVALNFSGGLDSLAAWALMPKNTELISVDFGGWFAREEKFFHKFPTHILRTNFRKLKYDRNSWTFMGAAALLYSEHLNIGYNVFGTILEADQGNFGEYPAAARTVDTPPFSYMGMKDIRYVNGLTEIGTAIVASYYFPDKIEESLESLAARRSEKRCRKEAILSIVKKRFNLGIDIEYTTPPENKLQFGENFAVDFLCLYICKYAGREVAERTVCNIPDEAFSLIKDCELTFYERLNTVFIEKSLLDDEMRQDYLNKLEVAGVISYTVKDFEEFKKVAKFLQNYHK